MSSIKRRMLDLVPEALKDHAKLLAARRRYKDCAIGSPRIFPTARIGKGCLISRDVEVGPDVSIGDYSYVNAGSIIASGTLGKFCSVGYYAQIGLPSHPTNFISTSPKTYGAENIFQLPMYWEDYQAPPVIENDVWIASNAVVMQGVRVANGAIVAANAVVTGDVPPYSIMAGVPAKILRRRFDDSTIEMLLAWQWWDLPLEQLQEFRETFRAGDRFARALAERLFGHL